jgi:hypothetical protein
MGQVHSLLLADAIKRVRFSSIALHSADMTLRGKEPHTGRMDLLVFSLFLV